MVTYMNKFRKLLFCSLIFVFLLSVNAFAETKELTIDINNEYTDAAFYITWENYEEKAEVSLISPNGTTYSKGTNPDEVYEASGEVIIHVGKAEKGAWKIKVTGEKLGTVDVSVGQIPDSLIIDSFTVTEQGGKCEAAYKVSDCPENIYIEIFADTDSQGYDGTQVYSGSGAASGTVELDMKRMATGEYHFYIRVSTDGIYNREYSDSIVSYQNPDIDDVVENVTGGKYNEGYYISWDCESEYDEFQVYVWDKDSNLKITEDLRGEDFYYGDFSENEDKVSLAVVKKNSRCNYEKIEVSADTELKADVVFDVEENITSHRYITADVSFDEKCTIDAFLNGEQMIEKEKEAGTYKVTMNDGENEVVFTVTDSKGNRREFVKEVYVDTQPPALSVTEDIDNLIVTKDYVYVSGYSEAGATLTLNGNKIEMKKGYFNEKVSLKLGENNIELIATDGAGNESRYTGTVKYEMSKESKESWIIVVVTAVILFIIYLVIFIRGIKRRKEEK